MSAGGGAGGLVLKHVIGVTCVRQCTVHYATVPDEGLFHMCEHRFLKTNFASNSNMLMIEAQKTVCQHTYFKKKCVKVKNAHPHNLNSLTAKLNHLQFPLDSEHTRNHIGGGVQE